MKRGILFLFLLLTMAGCKMTGSDEAMRYHDDGREKPVVTIIPVFERVDANLSWSLSDELTELVRERIEKKRNLFLTDEDDTLATVARLDESKHPFGTDFSWIKNIFNREQFVVFLELIEHDISPRATKAPFSEEVKSTYYLDMLVRVRVVDVRKPTPNIVLQEFVSYSHKIPSQGLEIDYKKNHYGKSSYPATPLGAGHRSLATKISQRLEDYILLAKSK